VRFPRAAEAFPQEEQPMPTRFRLFVFAAALAFLLAPGTPGSFAQAPRFAHQQLPRQAPPPVSYAGYHLLNDGLRDPNFGQYRGPALDAPFANGQPIDVLAEQARQADQRSESQRNHDEYLERVRIRAIQMEAGIPVSVMENPYRARSQEEVQHERDQRRVQQAHADPNAPDQSELLRNSKDRDFILRNFRTMYVDSSEAKFFSNDDMKAAFGRNKEFEKLKIRIVDDPRVADAVFKISYTFAWDYPFELRHQNTTIVLLSGKGEGPMYGPLGAVDVARQFVKAAKPWREEKEPSTKKDGESK
jgi:hypothetical protein